MSIDFDHFEKLGFDDWFKSQLNPLKSESFALAKILTVHKESYIITNGKWESRAEVTGKLMFSADSALDFPIVGDWCYVQFFGKDSPAIIHEILPRKSILKRKTPSKKVDFQAIAANIDTAFIVQSLDHDFSVNRIERYLVMIREGNITPIILLSKKDLLSNSELAEKISQISQTLPEIPIIAFTSLQHGGLNEIKEQLLPQKTFCLLGSSGVGKTTLLNTLLGSQRFATKSIREKDSKGRHTTTHRQLVMLENGAMIIDTPGMRELGSIGAQSGIDNVFDEIIKLEIQCKFNDCSHTQEIGCAILKAVESEEITSERFDNFKKLRNESAHNEMSLHDKRKKNKNLHKLYKSIQKRNVKN